MDNFLRKYGAVGCLTLLLIVFPIAFLIYFGLAWLLWNVLAVFAFGVTPLTGAQLAAVAVILWILSLIFNSSSSK